MDSLEEYLGRRKRNPKQRDFFDERADTWDSHVVHDPGKVRSIVGLLGLTDGMRVLDVGTGTGVMIPFYREAADVDITAMDYSENMVRVARGKNPEGPGLRFLVRDLYAMDEESEYDRVVCYSCFPHFPDPVVAISILSRSLRPGGLLCVAHSSSKEHINSVHRDGGEVISNDFLPPVELMAEMMEGAGLERVYERDDSECYIAIARRPARRGAPSSCRRPSPLPVLPSGSSHG